MPDMSVSHTANPPVLNIERTFNAPRDLVFKAWTEPERLKRWFGPKDWTLPVCEVDLRPGGQWHYCMRGPNGEESWGVATYEEISPPERLIYVDQFTDAERKVNPEMPSMRVTVDFLEENGATRIRSRTEFASREGLDTVLAMGVVEGFGQTYDRLDAYLTESVQ